MCPFEPVYQEYDPNFTAASLDEAYLDITKVCKERSMTGGEVSSVYRNFSSWITLTIALSMNLSSSWSINSSDLAHPPPNLLTLSLVVQIYIYFENVNAKSFLIVCFYFWRLLKSLDKMSTKQLAWHVVLEFLLTAYLQRCGRLSAGGKMLTNNRVMRHLLLLILEISQWF